MKLILALLPLLLLASCKLKPGCIVEEKVTNTVATALTNQLQCKRGDLVQKDVLAMVQKLGLCKQTPPTGPIADFVCPMLSKWAVDNLVNMSIPTSWECSVENAKAKALEVVTTACKKLPF